MDSYLHKPYMTLRCVKGLYFLVLKIHKDIMDNLQIQNFTAICCSYTCTFVIFLTCVHLGTLITEILKLIKSHHNTTKSSKLHLKSKKPWNWKRTVKRSCTSTKMACYQLPSMVQRDHHKMKGRKAC